MDSAGPERWRRSVGRRGVVLALEFEADTLAAWRISGHPDASIAKAHVGWSDQHALGFPRRVEEYLQAHPETSEQVAFLLYRACLQVGLTYAEVEASWGPANRIDTLQSRGLVRWQYGYGVEGQYDAVIFREGRLVQFLYVDPWDRAANPSDPGA